jgi:hypothetical protein
MFYAVYRHKKGGTHEIALDATSLRAAFASAPRTLPAHDAERPTDIPLVGVKYVTVK